MHDHGFSDLPFGFWVVFDPPALIASEVAKFFSWLIPR